MEKNTNNHGGTPSSPFGPPMTSAWEPYLCFSVSTRTQGWQEMTTCCSTELAMAGCRSFCALENSAGEAHRETPVIMWIVWGQKPEP